MRHGIFSLRAPVLWTPEPNVFGARVLLLGGTWSYVVVDEGSEQLPDLMRSLDGIDTSALRTLNADERISMETLADALYAAGAVEIIPYDSRPPRRLVAEMFFLGLLGRVLVKLSPHRVMAYISRHIEQGEEAPVPDRWMGELSESIVAAQHRAAAYPFATTQCIPVALSTYWFLRRRRKRASFRLAVSASPFEAHVWVRHDGHDLDPRSEAFAGSALEALHR